MKIWTIIPCIFIALAIITFHAISKTQTIHKLEYDTEGIFRSYLFGDPRLFRFVSYDDVMTPKEEMYGDLLIISDIETKKVVEIRWYDGENIHVLITDGRQKSMIELTPFTKNSLF